MSIVAAAFMGLTASKSSGANVALELALLVDVSGSVDATEYALQRDGYVAAFQSSNIKTLITSLAAQGGVAVTYVQWNATQQQSVGWMLLDDATDCDLFAAAILAAPRPGGSGTGVAGAITFGAGLFDDNTYTGGRMVIDVSGDGAENQGGNMAAARQAAINAGVDRINGLPILGDEANLLSFYQNQVQYGANSFTLPVDTFADFRPAIETKLIAEIRNTTVPEGGPSIAVMGAVLLGLAGIRSRISRRK